MDNGAYIGRTAVVSAPLSIRLDWQQPNASPCGHHIFSSIPDIALTSKHLFLLDNRTRKEDDSYSDITIEAGTLVTIVGHGDEKPRPRALSIVDVVLPEGVSQALTGGEHVAYGRTDWRSIKLIPPLKLLAMASD